MAASIYATPPPDLSSEDTALSDVSNSSLNHHNINNNNSNNNNNNRRNPSNTQTQESSEASATAKKSKRSNVAVAAAAAAVDALMDTLSESQQHTKKEIKEETEKTNRTTLDIGSTTNAFAEAAAAITLSAATQLNTTTAQDANAAAMAAVAAAANAAMQLQLLEAINDAAKKRRKQNNPSRLGGAHSAGEGENEERGEAEQADEQEVSSTAALREDEGERGEGPMTIDYEEKLSKMFLPKSMEQLKETLEIIQKQQQEQLNHISTEIQTTEIPNAVTMPPENEVSNDEANAEKIPNFVADFDAQTITAQEQLNESLGNPYQTYCRECGENFESEFKLGLHMLEEHGPNGTGEDAVTTAGQGKEHLTPFDILASVKVKLERPDYDSQSPPPATSSPTARGGAQSEQPTTGMSNGKNHQWLNNMPPTPSGMGFAFPSEAAAALSASGYLPLLGVPGFPSVDGLNRPPLRIFNPEAYCDLCNKEFCNKYFLKTHKANKHGIYDPATSTSGDQPGQSVVPSASVGGAMNQMFQLQMQQQHQHMQAQQQQQQHQQQQQQQQLQQKREREQQLSSESLPEAQQVKQHFHQQLQQLHQLQPTPPQPMPPSNSAQANMPPAPPPVFCDICSKRFTNVFAMRRHRAKTHEQRTSPSESQTHRSETISDAKQQDSGAMQPTADTVAKASFQMPEGFRQDFSLEQEEVSFTPQPKKLSPPAQQQAREANFAHDKLKRLGVLSPEAFCELCCKEYCNKYFLRTHKWKRHGIFVPPDDGSKDPGDAALMTLQPNAVPWPFMNLPGMPGMPLNLMMANEKAVAAQRMLAAAAEAKSNEEMLPLAKRIKLEVPDADSDANELKSNGPNSFENPDNKAENKHAAEPRGSSASATPELQKQQQESLSNLPPSPESAAAGLQNLQKLQSMIQQLNELNGKRPLVCQLCGKEYDHQYALHIHMMTEHAAEAASSAGPPPSFSFQQHILQQQQAAIKLSPNGSPSSMPLGGITSNSGELRCYQCERDFATAQEFKQHIAEVHLLPGGGSPLRDGFVTPERPILNPNAATGARPPYTMTPTSSYCEICNKELCNKYFMKTHMQRMHGIEIENGAQIGGVVCNICNKELCSKYFLRVHKHNTHGIIEEGAPLPQPRQNGLAFEQQQPQPQIFEAELGRGMSMSPFGSSDAKNDIYQQYNEPCPLCSRRFRSPKWLRGHLLSDHGPAGTEKLRELEQQFGSLSKPESPTLKIPNGGAVASTGLVPNPVNLAQALQNLNSQHLLGNIPKNAFPGMFGNVAEQALAQSSPRFKEYQCTLCPFTTPYYAFLYIHERSHSILNQSAANSSSPPAAEGQQQQQQTALQHEQLESEETNESALAKSYEDQEKVFGKSPSQQQLSPMGLSERHVHEATDLSQRKMESNEMTPPPQVSTSPSTANGPVAVALPIKESRSVTASPLASPKRKVKLPQDIIKEIAQKSGKPACYAVPQVGYVEQEMQAFIIEERSSDSNTNRVDDGAGNEDKQGSNNRFVPAIIYLPVTERITGPLTVSFTLTPA